jgi:UPF0176 protein
MSRSLPHQPPLPSPSPPGALHSAFYRFACLEDPPAAARELRERARGLAGSIIVAREGVNGTVAGEPRAIRNFETALCGGAALQGALRGIAFKHSACVTPPFGRLKVSVKPEIVALELPQTAGATALPAPDGADASHLSPPAWRELIASGTAVLLDNRSHFEFRLGHFRGAIDPQVNDFREFVAYVEQQAPAWRVANKPVAMYCTGGIRCDKTAPWLRGLGLQVLQLDGGILNYFQQLPDAEREWTGECFVFDRRIALDSHLQETSTCAEQVFDARNPDEAWRLRRALELDGGGA